MSHYSEKIRWTLEASGLTYTEVAMTPVLHLLPALLMGAKGETTLPILKISPDAGKAEHVQDSTAILRWLDQHRGPLAVMPRERALREDIMGIEARFDAIGKDIARFLFLRTLQDDGPVLEMWTRYAGKAEAALLRLFFPVIKWSFKRRLRINPDAAAQSELRIQQALAWLDGRLSDGRLYLSGQHLSVADITAASILAPLVCPIQHPVYGTERYRQRLGPAPGWLGNRPCAAWVRCLYENERYAPVVVAANSAQDKQAAA